VIPATADQPAGPRNQVERSVSRLQGWRRAATRDAQREVNDLAMGTIAEIVLLWPG
jgi:hypothetical protein